LPNASKGFWAKATQLVTTVFSRVCGEGFFGEIQEFLGLFSGMFASMRDHAVKVRELLQSEESAFVLVTSPEPSALAEVAFFRDQIKKKGLPFAGYVLNRSWAYTRGFVSPDTLPRPEEVPACAAEASRKLLLLADEEMKRAIRDRALLSSLRERAEGASATASPHLGEGIEDLRGLVDLAQCLVVPSAARG
jgi:anion-transporting  ArsA/GET3 family ATPase